MGRYDSAVGQRRVFHRGGDPGCGTLLKHGQAGGLWLLGADDAVEPLRRAIVDRVSDFHDLRGRLSWDIGQC